MMVSFRAQKDGALAESVLIVSLFMASGCAGRGDLQRGRERASGQKSRIGEIKNIAPVEKPGRFLEKIRTGKCLGVLSLPRSNVIHTTSPLLGA